MQQSTRRLGWSCSSLSVELRESFTCRRTTVYAMVELFDGLGLTKQSLIGRRLSVHGRKQRERVDDGGGTIP